MSVPVLHTFVVGEVATASNVNNNTVTLGNFLLVPPLCIVRQTTGQGGLTSSTWFDVNMQTEEVDTDNGHSTVTNIPRYTGNTPGYYLFAGVVGLGTFVAAGGRRGTRWAVNGAAVNAGEVILPGGVTTAIAIPALTRHIFLNGTTDYVTLQVFQDSGNTESTDATVAERQSTWTARWSSS